MFPKFSHALQLDREQDKNTQPDGPSSRGRGQVPCILHHPSPHPCAHTFPNNPCTVPAPHLSWQGELMCHFCLFLTPLPSDLVNLASLGAAIAVECIFFLLIPSPFPSRPIPCSHLNNASLGSYLCLPSIIGFITDGVSSFLLYFPNIIRSWRLRLFNTVPVTDSPHPQRYPAAWT